MLLSMRLFYLLNLLTFVAGLIPTVALASPKSVHRPAPVKNPIKSAPENEKPDVTKQETTQISYPDSPIAPPSQPTEDLNVEPTKKFEVKASTHKLNQFSLIFDSGRFIDSDINKNILVAHYQRTLVELDSAELNMGFGLSPQSIAMMNLGQKWIWRTWSTDEGHEYPLFFSFNVLNYIDSSQMLAGLINVNHFKLQLVFGLENIEVFQESFSAEIGAAYGINGFSTSAALGWKF